jgi:hypothetical protein
MTALTIPTVASKLAHDHRANRAFPMANICAAVDIIMFSLNVVRPLPVLAEKTSDYFSRSALTQCRNGGGPSIH